MGEVRGLIPRSEPNVGGISCASTTMCVEVGANGSTSEKYVTNGSLTSWANPSGPGSSPLSGVSCSSTSDCVAVGFTYGGSENNSVATYTTNGGSTWSTATGTPSGTALSSVSCLSGTSTCVAVGNAIYLENYFVEVSSGDYDFVGDVIVTSSNGGESWTSDTNTPTNDRNGLSGISCATSSACLAVGPTAYRHRGRHALGEHRGAAVDGSPCRVPHRPCVTPPRAPDSSRRPKTGSQLDLGSRPRTTDWGISIARRCYLCRARQHVMSAVAMVAMTRPRSAPPTAADVGSRRRLRGTNGRYFNSVLP